MLFMFCWLFQVVNGIDKLANPLECKGHDPHVETCRKKAFL